MARTNASAHLAKVPLFAACSKKELALIAKATDVVSLPDGHALTTQDETSREAFVITAGKAVVRRNKRKVAELGAGAVIGELGLLDRGPRTATVVADGPIEVLVIGPREFSALLDEVPTINHKLLKSLAGKVRELDKAAFG
ncbi:cyclic nucleotide-binding domain-containing protein [Actinospongicola halichondriae]|uniref:cyclic nucleotide-binding domain-containing protein n=1 Tax=Actinospongicola halichondriae TaxID=3236844 RepID=UPI003D4E571E